jgi:hypothetical protein
MSFITNPSSSEAAAGAESQATDYVDAFNDLPGKLDLDQDLASRSDFRRPTMALNQAWGWSAI